MHQKVLLILADAMRPDSIMLCGHPFARELIRNSRSTMRAQTVNPSLTLPAHMSLFHSVEPSRHGVLANTYIPQVRPVMGLADRVAAGKKTAAFFYTWEQLRDLSQPGSLSHSFFCSARCNAWRTANRMMMDHAVVFLRGEAPDFAFLYLCSPDEMGHRAGWMTKEYIDTVYDVWDDIERAFRCLPEGYTTIVTADHGGHDRMHGTDMPEDMTIPLIINGVAFPAGSVFPTASILDIAPTAAALLGIEGDEAWQGKSLVP